MMNESGIHPKGHRILVLPIEVEEVTAGGIVLAKEIVQKEQNATMEGTFVEAGAAAWKDTADPSEWVNPGDKVLFGKYVGQIRKGKDGKLYRLMNDLDLIAGIDE